MQVLSAISQLENSKAQQLAAMILATSQRLDQLWAKCTPTMVLGWLAKAQVSESQMYLSPPAECTKPWSMSKGSTKVVPALCQGARAEDADDSKLVQAVHQGGSKARRAGRKSSTVTAMHGVG
jgi:hypothetical protein